MFSRPAVNRVTEEALAGRVGGGGSRGGGARIPGNGRNSGIQGDEAWSRQDNLVEPMRLRDAR